MPGYAFGTISSISSNISISIRDQAAAEARRVLFECASGATPVDPFDIASRLGVEVVEERLDPDISGILQLRKSGGALVFLNRADGVRRKRFTCAHEIGHYVKHLGEGDNLEHVDYRDEAASQGVDADERFANSFAASLLMPDYLVERQVAMGEGEREMADFFEVSEAALVNRLKGLGLFSL
ncbi:MAG TPA: ImmA/IrrE family metallo-endopeptidase [Solirubrobacterales bacterium]|nr:ImmA/IrrE family metallo-endopeptidase [Solirubrobacterales bacterium]